MRNGSGKTQEGLTSQDDPMETKLNADPPFFPPKRFYSDSMCAVAAPGFSKGGGGKWSVFSWGYDMEPVMVIKV